MYTFKLLCKSFFIGSKIHLRDNLFVGFVSRICSRPETQFTVVWYYDTYRQTSLISGEKLLQYSHETESCDSIALNYVRFAPLSSAEVVFMYVMAYHASCILKPRVIFMRYAEHCTEHYYNVCIFVRRCRGGDTEDYYVQDDYLSMLALFLIMHTFELLSIKLN